MLTIRVKHPPREGVELLADYPLLSQTHEDALSTYVLKTDKADTTVCIRQRHALNSWHWWLPMLCPIAFLQGAFMRYEHQYLDDYFAQIRLRVHSGADDGVIEVELGKQFTGQKADRGFYINFRKDQYLIPKTDVYHFGFRVIGCDGCNISDQRTDMPVPKAFEWKWRAVRGFAALVTYGALIVFLQLYALWDYRTHGLGAGVCIGAGVVLLLYYYLIVMLKKVATFPARVSGKPWKE